MFLPDCFFIFWISTTSRLEISESGKSITESNSVDDIVNKFRSKYGASDVKKYYPKHNVAVEVDI
jgi:hypothetical protein